jgi:WD40 repeat protein
MMSGMTGAERAEVMVRMTFGPNHGITFDPSGALLGIASTDKTATVWDVTTGVPVATLAGHGSSVTAIAFSPVSPPGQVEVATGSLDGIARTWDAATGRPGVTLSGHTSWVHALASGAHLATLVPLPSGGYITLLPDARYKLDGDPGDCLWWAAGLRRLGPAEVSSRFPEVRRLPPDAPILPA